MTAARLAQAQSAYLRSAKDQPVDWHPWGSEAFERARMENKPVLLDIGAVWCHWCHVMDHESYEDARVAELLNRDWVCIKVDRDERPDVDARYQRAIQALTGQGGWPLTGFLTPDGEVFYGGTYFPPDSRWGRPGFRSVLGSLAKLFRESPDRVTAQADEIRRHLASGGSGVQAGPISQTVLVDGAKAMARLYDARNGGFGDQPKFPHPGACEFLLTRWFDTGDAQYEEIVRRTLTGMANGGVRDHLGGGFHRYSTDARWIVPHFEKMLYDNSELLRTYIAAASSISAAPAASAAPAPSAQQVYRDVIEGVVTWINEVMSDPRGGYYASQDADVGPQDDGDYFTWTPDEVRAFVDVAEFDALARYYDIDDAGEMHHNPKKNVLWVNRTVAQVASSLGKQETEVAALLESGRAKLREARAARPTPFVDPTIYTAWNAMMSSAMLAAAAFLDRRDLGHHALATLERLFATAASSDLSHGMRHAVDSSVGHILDDQIQTANACLDAYEATGSRNWLDRTITLMELAWDRYRSDAGGLLDRPRGKHGEGFLDQEITPMQDSPTPSPNGVAGIVLSRLAEHTDDARWRERRDELLEVFAGKAAELSVFGAALLRALDWAVMPPTHVVVVGSDNTETRALLRSALATFRPRKVVKWVEPGSPVDMLPAPVAAMLDGTAPRVYVCAGTQCAPPVATPEDVATTLEHFQRPTSP
jgi:uncharacterized protein YyaL (SSP411 family)